MVIISGDFFDHGFVTKETLEHINGQFESAPACKFVIAPGNHDCADPKSPYKKAVFPPNVYIFGSEELSKFEFPDIGVDVYGWAFTSPEMEKCPIEHYVKVNPKDKHSRLSRRYADEKFPLLPAYNGRYCPQ